MDRLNAGALAVEAVAAALVELEVKSIGLYCKIKDVMLKPMKVVGLRENAHENIVSPQHLDCVNYTVNY